MSTAHKINSVTAVSAIADTDSVLAIVDEQVKRVKVSALDKQSVETQYANPGNNWTRIAQWQDISGASAIVHVTTGLWVGFAAGHILAITNRYRSTPLVTQLLGEEIKVRILKKDDMYCLDVYTNCQKMRMRVDGQSVTPLAIQNADTTGYTTVTEKTLSSALGGGNLLHRITERRGAA